MRLAHAFFAGLLFSAITTCATAQDRRFINRTLAQEVPPALNVCNDYGSPVTYWGVAYWIVEPDRIVTRHEGIDFCAPAGSTVIAAVDGTVDLIEANNPVWGGRVMILTEYSAEDGKAFPGGYVYVDALHIQPKSGLKLGDSVKAGDTIGVVGEVGPRGVGPRSHVHFSVRETRHQATHLDPNDYWQGGPGHVTCFDQTSPPKIYQLVAPLKC